MCASNRIKDVTFNAEEVMISLNGEARDLTIKNLTFRNAKLIRLWHCGITLEKLKEFTGEMTFDKDSHVTLDLSFNSITIQELQRAKFALPRGVEMESIQEQNSKQTQMRMKMNYVPMNYECR